MLQGRDLHSQGRGFRTAETAHIIRSSFAIGY